MFFLHNKLPQFQHLKATQLCYPIASVSQEGHYVLARSSAWVYGAEIQVLAQGFNSCLRFVVLIQAHGLLAKFISTSKGHVLPCPVTLGDSSQFGYLLPRPIWPTQDNLILWLTQSQLASDLITGMLSNRIHRFRLHSRMGWGDYADVGPWGSF